MIHTRFLGQWGNQAFQLVLSHILASKTGLEYTPPREFLDKHGKPVKWSGATLFTMRSTPGRHAEGTPQVVNAEQWFDWDSLDPNRPIIISQIWGQRYEYLQSYKEQIKTDWLRLQRPFVQVDDTDIFLHCRRTDYQVFEDGNPPDPLRNGCATSIDEYRRCLAKFPDACMVRIVTDDYRDPFIKQLGDSLGLPWVADPRPWDEDFLLLASARWLICSQSTFSWWAGFLGRAERIVVPVFKGSFWANGLGLIGPQMGPGGRDFPNLQPTDDPRWIWLTE